MSTPRRYIRGLLGLLGCLLLVPTAWCALPSPPGPPTAPVLSAVFENGTGIPDSFNNFVEVFGATTLSEAKLEFDCVRKVHPHMDVALYDIPVSVRGGEFHGSLPYGVFVASYATGDEARAAMAAARRAMDFPAIMRCLGVTGLAGATASTFDRQASFVFHLQAPKARWPLAIERSPLAPVDAISSVRALPGVEIATASPATASTAAPPAKLISPNDPVHAVVSGKSFETAELAGEALYVLRTLRPDVHFAAIQQGRVYYLTVAAFLTRGQADIAVREMRARGLYALTNIAEFSQSQMTYTAVSGVPAVDVKLKPIFIDSPHFDSKSSVVPYSIIEAEDLLEPLTDRVKRCVTQVTRMPPQGAVNMTGTPMPPVSQITGRNPQDFANCTGIVLSDEAVTRCIMGSDCHGVRFPVGFQMKPKDLLRACLQGDETDGNPAKPNGVNVCLGTSLAGTIRGILKEQGIKSCLLDPKSTACAAATAQAINICSQPAYRDACAQIPDLQAAVVKSWDSVQRCLAAGLCGAVVPRPADMVESFNQAAAMAELKADEFMGPAKSAFGFMDVSADTLASTLNNCLGKPETGSDNNANCLVNLGAHSAELDVAKCMHDAADVTAVAGCMPKGTSAASAAAAVQCVQQGGTGFDSLINCAGDALPAADRDAAAAARKVFDCVSQSTDARAAIASCAGQLVSAPPELQSLVGAAQCLANKGSADDISLSEAAGCVRSFDKTGQAALCVAQAKSDSDEITCVSGAISMDPKTAQMVGCLAQSNGSNEAMGACVAGRFLPPQVARVAACVASSPGAASLVLCAAGPQMNEEWRIAAECAVESGGNPVGFGGCTAGRLTVAELEKCLKGQIGTDGGCFGPNNTFRQIVEAYFHVLADVLGPSSSIGTTVRAIGRFCVSVGDAAASQIDKATNWTGKTFGLKRVFGW